MIQSGSKGQLLILPNSRPMERTSEAKDRERKSGTLLPFDSGVFLPSDFVKVPSLEDMKEDSWLEVLSEPHEGKVAVQLVEERDQLWCLEEMVLVLVSSCKKTCPR